ncbi:McbB family protein [Streptococcus suis]|uniref:McbB family protein n=1 Tax=Streptococcus suis TaxID=1307 RepID=UPI000695DC03|nr:McbB family protein [Streptococcus suis]MDY7283301.1 McbB family protein [Streptococcus suis]NQG77211.1 McbB family protein [Streptococcus suis]NQH59280.1 McbB family protein [Streptococcus suis]NQN47202.1 McbB family protein [Streptococcus suis]NQN55235.1 McbB family protein [Streptococcus suis]
MYRFNPFIINHIESKAIVQSINGITVIENSKLIQYLEMIDSTGESYCLIEDIQQYFPEQTSEIVQFLTEANLIYELERNRKKIRNIGVYTNNGDLKEIIKKIGVDISVFEDISQLKKFDCIFIFLNIFTPVKLYKICDDFRNYEIPFCIAFVYNSKIYISNLYLKSWYNPCPKCFFSNLESELRGFSQYEAEISFQTIIDVIYSKNVAFEINTPLSNEFLIYVVNEIIKLKHSDTDISAFRIKEIDFKGSVRYDVATNFELCDCFEI